MAGNGGFAVSRRHGGDRFYNPPAMRRHQQLLQQQQQQLLQRQHNQLQQPPTAVAADTAVVEAENRTYSDDSTTTLSKPTSVCSSSPPTTATSETNLDRLVESVTPFVPAQYCSEVNGRGWRSREAGLRPFYCLGDLWKSLKEWSVYGAGVPLLLNGTDSIMQYYVPYLSGIQLYIDPPKPPSKSRQPGEKSNAESSRDTSSGGSSDYEADRRTKCATDGVWSQQNIVNLNSLNSLSLREKSLMSSSGDEGEISNSSGLLVFEYLEKEQPHFRKPLTDKVSTLASQFPELSLYRSCDLLPASWISIAWYPIYRIPMGSTLKDLDASFLTIHSLSTHSRNSVQPQFHGASGGQKVNGVSGAASKISLPVIGLASYKYQGSLLTPCGPQEREKENSLLQAANDWLQGLQVVLPDFQFFRSHYTPWR